MITVLLIIHGLLAVALLGAVTHQAISVVGRPGSRSGFFGKLRGVSGPAYVDAVVVLFLLTFVLGGFLYPAYRIDVRPLLEEMRWKAPTGVFEIKEHFAAIGFGLLPAYRWSWQPSAAAASATRTRGVLTWILAVVVWWGFLVGHILNNLKGLI